jgi:hypothetical protein
VFTSNRPGGKEASTHSSVSHPMHGNIPSFDYGHRYILLNLRDEMCVKQKSSLCSLQKDEAPKTKLKLLIAVMLTLSVFKI